LNNNGNFSDFGNANQTNDFDYSNTALKTKIHSVILGASGRRAEIYTFPLPFGRAVSERMFDGYENMQSAVALIKRLACGFGFVGDPPTQPTHPASLQAAGHNKSL
jgi:hypothetical protein